MPLDEFLQVCRLVGKNTSDAGVAEAEYAANVAQATAEPSIPSYSGQQVAAFKAHATMARRDLERSTGAAREAAARRLARYEAKVADALSQRQSD
jgi:hypothetical protein